MSLQVSRTTANNTFSFLLDAIYYKPYNVRFLKIPRHHISYQEESANQGPSNDSRNVEFTVKEKDLEASFCLFFRKNLEKNFPFFEKNFTSSHQQTMQPFMCNTFRMKKKSSKKIKSLEKSKKFIWIKVLFFFF